MANAEFTQVARRGNLKSIISGYALILPALLLVIVIIAYPAILSIIQTLTTRMDGSTASFTLDQYNFFFNDPLSTTNLVYTLLVAVLVVGLLFVICFPI